MNAAQALLQRYKTKEPKNQYEVGQQVWLEGKNIPFNIPTRKLAPKRYGPFKITKKISTVTYQLDLPEYMRIHNVFHIDLITPYKETEQYGPAFTPPQLHHQTLSMDMRNKRLKLSLMLDKKDKV